VAFALQVLEFGVPIGFGAAIFATAAYAARGAVRMVVTGELRVVLRSAFTMPHVQVEGDGIDDGAPPEDALTVVYCHRDGRVGLIATRRSAQCALQVAHHSF
jgi:hypothetical protein